MSRGRSGAVFEGESGGDGGVMALHGVSLKPFFFIDAPLLDHRFETVDVLWQAKLWIGDIGRNCSSTPSPAVRNV